MGVAGTLSFYPGKNLEALGDAGWIVCNDGGLAEKSAMFARHGGLKKGDHAIEGMNSRMEGRRAAILGAKLKSLHAWTKRRVQLAAANDNALARIDGVQTPPVRSGASHVYNLYLIRAENRDQPREHLWARGVETLINHPCCLPLLQAYSWVRPGPAGFPEAFRAQNEVLSLPMHPYLSNADIEYVADVIAEFYSRRALSVSR